MMQLFLNGSVMLFDTFYHYKMAAKISNICYSVAVYIVYLKVECCAHTGVMTTLVYKILISFLLYYCVLLCVVCMLTA